MNLQAVTENKQQLAQTSETQITYEQPLNEHTRLYLRLEHLFKQLDYNLLNNAAQSSRLALETLLHIVDLADRPDLKSKLLQTLRQHSAALAQLDNIDHAAVDSDKLQKILHHLDLLIDGLHCHGSTKLGDKLRHNSFLKNIRLHLNHPAGPCHFNIPAYSLWLHQPENKRAATLARFTKEFDLLKEAVLLILRLTRNSCPARRVIAVNRFYQQPLDYTLPCQLVSITLPVAYNLYPEFSVGKHRLSIQFKSFSLEGSSIPTTTKDDIPFDLCCHRV